MAFVDCTANLLEAQGHTGCDVLRPEALPLGLTAGSEVDVYAPRRSVGFLHYCCGGMTVLKAALVAACLFLTNALYAAPYAIAAPVFLLFCAAAVFATAKSHRLKFDHAQRALVVTSTHLACCVSTKEEVPYSDIIGVKAETTRLRRGAVILSVTLRNAPSVPLGTFPAVYDEEAAAWRAYVKAVTASSSVV